MAPLAGQEWKVALVKFVVVGACGVGCNSGKDCPPPQISDGDVSANITVSVRDALSGMPILPCSLMVVMKYTLDASDAGSGPLSPGLNKSECVFTFSALVGRTVYFVD